MTNEFQAVPDFPGDLTVSDDGSAVVETPQVHTEETSERPMALPAYRVFITSGCTSQMTAARTAYDNFRDDGWINRLRSFDLCRSTAWFVRHKVTGKIRVASSRCGLRWCPLCIRTKRFIITTSVAAWLKEREKPKFLTLTLKHSTAPLSNQIDALYGFFKEFKRRPWFKKRLKGGVWFFQVKVSATDGLWHPHLHILFEGRFLPHADCSKKWCEITHGSSVVDIRAVNNPRKAAEYVARYAAAPCDLASLDADRAVDVIRALHHRRIVGVFGTAAGLKLASTPPPDAADWEYLGSFGLIMHNAEIGSSDSEIVECWRSGASCSLLPEKPPPDEVKEAVMSAEPESFRQAYLPFF